MTKPCSTMAGTVVRLFLVLCFMAKIKMLPSKLLQCAACIILILLPAIIHLMEAGCCVNNGYQNNI